MRWIGVALMLGCVRPEAAPERPTAETAGASTPTPPADTCARRLPWVEQTTYFHYREVQNGHFGYLELHADFNRLVVSDTFDGVVVLTYRVTPSSPPEVEAVTMAIPANEIIGWLRALRDHVQGPPDAPGSELVAIHDASRSMHLSIDAVPYKTMNGEGSVQFYSEEGERQPAPWGIRGCQSNAGQSAQRSIAVLIGEIHQRIGRDAMLAKLGPRHRGID